MEYDTIIKKIRTYWQFQHICQFFMIFYPAYGLESFETDVIFSLFYLTLRRNSKNALAVQDKDFITFYILKLVKNINFGRFLNQTNWEGPTLKEIRNADVELPLPKNLPDNFFALTIFQQIACIQHLTELQLRDSYEKIRKALGDEENCLDWRVLPIGTDRKGNIYYLFDDNRLYIQKPVQPAAKRSKSRKSKKTSERSEQQIGDSFDQTWEPVCITLQDWESFPATLKNSRNADEKDLYDTLIEDVLPQVIVDLKAKERKKKKIIELATLVPKRSSRLQEKSRLQKIEEEKQEKQRLLEELQERSKSKNSKSHTPIAYSRELRAQRRDLKLKGKVDELYELEKRCIVDAMQGSSASNTASDDGGWDFSCVCGKYGRNFDDGTPQVACETCNVWQHIACVKYATPSGKPVNNFDDIPFYCEKCKSKAATAEEVLEDLVESLDNSNEEDQPPVKIRISLQKLASSEYDGLSDTPEEALSPRQECNFELQDSLSAVPAPTLLSKEALSPEQQCKPEFQNSLSTVHDPMPLSEERSETRPESPSELLITKGPSSLSGHSSPGHNQEDTPAFEIPACSNISNNPHLSFDEIKVGSICATASPFMELSALPATEPGVLTVSSNALSSNPNSPVLIANSKRSLCKTEEDWTDTSPSKKARHVDQ
ncbi:hypothetical protein DSO57_1007444 [Entomophthora muscae]|uniref:Uncharacterized protein n=1 Tax=Entomophthora muscae TaxID=34485 RepID=A0ACC2U603_9FUNG|nr:hypothetical protein DSO57_1007444 [Entomophthora muscae]